MTDYALVFALIAAGLVLLALGGDLVIKGGVGVARGLELSPLFVGIVLLGFGTSLPELATSVEAVRVGSSDVAIGNVVGSNIANILLIIGLAATLAAARVNPILLARNGVAMTLAMLLFAAILLFNGLSAEVDLRVEIGLALIGLLLAYLLVSALFGSERQEADAQKLLAEGVDPSDYNVPRSLGIFGLGLLATLGGAYLLVEGAITLARDAAIPEAIIGATVVAIGTSLPELAATIAAARSGKSNLAVGNIIGSNIFNSLGIVGVATLFGPMPTPAEVMRLDLWVMLIAAALFMAFASSGGRINRFEGVLLLTGYVLYLTVSAQTAVGGSL